ncbi:hypothetical protein QQS21_005498 [Conoideocrella luteorostrata]|uniref:Uncharacterized protein n=1 Tax=Conoideocrella luteorostrata TaxID=1105319 RepID=A0AAJ0G0W1_9HYPO|nr:hypothetical protein QQS21_005498 [Conoideocrella luteorostrata]
MLTARGRRYVLLAIALISITIAIVVDGRTKGIVRERYNKYKGTIPPIEPKEKEIAQPKYLLQPEQVPPPVVDPFPSLATSPPPPIPKWNVAPKNLYKKYGLDYAPPLFIGFTRGWPLLLQVVVSWITAGWPAEHIYVIENTGTQWANPRGKLSLQNPFYLNHGLLKRLGVNVIQTPVLLNFAQLQNFYTHLAHEHKWPQYFWSHMDIIVFSWEDGGDGRPRAGEKGYKTIYENALAELNTTRHSNERWATRFFAYDAFTLVNREAYDEVGGWDTYIPYYITDCDMHNRLNMHNWTLSDRGAGIITDVSTVLKDLRALYRDSSAELGFTDPNPPPPEPESENKEASINQGEPDIPKEDGESADKWYWRKLLRTVDQMGRYKHGNRGRNTWQIGQKGGEKEPFYYPAHGVQKAFEMLAEAGRQIYAEKWGHRNCELIGEGKLKLEDQWRVAHDWE